MIHTVKGFGVDNKAEIDVFLELSHFFDDSTDVGTTSTGFWPHFRVTIMPHLQESGNQYPPITPGREASQPKDS